MDKTQCATAYDQLSKKNQLRHGRDLLDCFLHFPADEKLKILDLGCGTGDVASLLAEKYKNSTIHGCDPSKERIALAQQNNARPQISYFVGDAISFLSTKENEYDVIFSSAVLHWITDKQSVLAAIKKALKPDGISFHWVVYMDLDTCPYSHFLNPDEIQTMKKQFPCITEGEWKKLVTNSGMILYFVDSKEVSYRDYLLDECLEMMDSIKDLTGVSLVERFNQYPDKQFLRKEFKVTDDGHVGWGRTIMRIGMRKPVL